MRITVPLTLEIEVPSQEEAAQYLILAPDGTPTTEVSPNFLADLFDDGLQDMFAYEEHSVIKVCGYTKAAVREILARQIP